MTVQKVFVKNRYDGNGSKKNWPITFDWDKNHQECIKVYTRVNGVLSQTTNFTIQINEDTGNYEVFYPAAGNALASGDKIIIARELPLQQVLNLVNQGPFFADDIEITFDEVVMMCQQLNERLGRSLKVGIDIDSDSDIDVTLPVPTDEKNYGLRMTKDGFQLVNDPSEVYDDTVAIKNQAEAARDTAKAWAEENAGASPSLINGAKSSKQWAQVSQSFANDASTIKSEVTTIAGANYHNVYNAVVDIDSKVSASHTNADNAKSEADRATAQATIATTKASEAAASASAAASSASSASTSSASAIQALRDATLIKNDGNADTLSTTNAADIIELKEDLVYLTDKTKFMYDVPLKLDIKHTNYFYIPGTREEYPANGYSTMKPITIPFDCIIKTQSLANYFCSYYDGTAYTKFGNSEGDSSPKIIELKKGHILYITIAGTTISSQNVTIMSKEKGLTFKHTFYVGANRGFTKLIDGINEALKYNGSTLYVDGGDYDLIQEFGSSYFENYSSSTYPQGIGLYNDIHIIFSSDARVTCHYTGNNENVLKYFSPFNATVYHRTTGFTLENLHLEASRVRYCVHDELDGADGTYHHKYLECNMKIDNTNNPSWHSTYEIGGGLGSQGNIVVKNCEFYNGGVSYHNGGTSSCQNRLVVENNYFDNGTFRFTYWGTSTKISTAYVCGNSFKTNIITGAEAPSATTNNIELIEWNNIVRTN